ncbi:hypothetical protein [Ancylomarina longa]|uniref:Copper chaperone NosL n=1 Tax=Ancylomarina longa TaxID=2487017 RepID=A0A434AY58_9BACT|nr:hypothetical protein [Ancylomarina longa]RUT79371.1 hypothetical protein DLK05_03885 [Ancylomarina longa]
MKNKSRILMILAAVMLLGLFFSPLWKIRLEAPQYPNGVNMYIWINQITGDTPSTLQNINILNHYIGMEFIKPDSIPELTYFPFVIIGMVLLGIGIAFTKKRKLFVFWGVILMILGALGIYDFYLWEFNYGHNLSPTAPIKIPGMVYQPPVFGSKMLLNFKAISLPYYGSLFLVLSMIFNILSYSLNWKNWKK